MDTQQNGECIRMLGALPLYAWCWPQRPDFQQHFRSAALHFSCCSRSRIALFSLCRYSEAINLLLPQQQLATAAAHPLLPAPPGSTASSTVIALTGAFAARNTPHPASAISTTATATAVAATASAQILSHSHTAPPVCTADVPELRALLSNRSLACLKAGKAAAAAEDAAAVVALAPGWHKGHWRLGKALSSLSRCESYRIGLRCRVWMPTSFRVVRPPEFRTALEVRRTPVLGYGPLHSERWSLCCMGA
jgi:hypothetical protein